MTDEDFMRAALELADAAEQQGEVPVRTRDLNHQAEVWRRVLAGECLTRLQRFFRQERPA